MMKWIVALVFIALIGYLFEQRRHIKFLKQANYNQETRHIMMKQHRCLLEQQLETCQYALDILGYDRNEIIKGHYTRHEPSPEKQRAMYAEFKKKESICRSKNMQFDIELELRGVE